MKTINEVIAERCASDPEFAEEWERSAPARQVSIAVISLRGDWGMTQQEFADRLGVPLAVIELLEAA